MNKINILSNQDASFPTLLHEIYNPPDSIYYLGQFSNSMPTIAIVGTRKPTEYGRKIAYSLSYDLAKFGFSIVSGMALGIDAVAHRAALDAKGHTIAIMPAGLNHMCPRTNLPLAKNIIESGGAIISSLPAKTRPQKFHFLARNRIVAGISLAVVVIEAAARSGTTSTVSFALEQGREVMAVPGPVDSVYSAGTNKLIAQGAAPVSTIDDVVNALGVKPQ